MSNHWNNMGYFPRGRTLGTRQMYALFCHVAKDRNLSVRFSQDDSYANLPEFRGVRESLERRGLLESHQRGHNWFSCRITEKGLREFIQNGGDRIRLGSRDFRPEVKNFLVRSRWAEREEWMKYMALGYLPAA